MDVVAHTTIAEEADAVRLELFAKQILVAALVLVGLEDFLGIIAEVSDAMLHADRRYPRLSGHFSASATKLVNIEIAESRWDEHV